MLNAQTAASLSESRSNAAPQGAAKEAARKFGFSSGQIIQEFYFDDDVDMPLRDAISAVTGEELVDEDFSNTTDGAIIWWRAEDAEEDDLTDLLMDAAANLDDGGNIWVLSPKAGREGHVAAADVEEAADTSGMHASGTIDAARDWIGMKLVSRPRSH